MREARLAAALNHNNAVSVYDVVEHAGETWLVMEYLPSRTLSQLIAAEGRLSPERVAHIGAQVAAALSSAHSLGIIHRDIKPGNILVGDDDVAKISDFGIARGQADMRLTQTGMVTGTPAFFSPELARGDEASFASDVWALGITLYTATEGAPPHEPQANPLAMLSVIANEAVPQPLHAGPLTSALAAMLDPDATRRCSMAQALTALRQAEKAAGARQPSPATDPTTTPQERPIQATAIEDPIEPDYEQPVVLPPASGRWVDEPATAADPPRRQRSAVGRLLTAALGVLVLIGAGALLFNVLGSSSRGHDATSSTGAGAHATSTAGSRHHTGTNTGSGSSGSSPASTSTTSTAPTSTSDTPATSSGPTTSTTSSSAPGGGTDASTPEDFTRLYFSTVPGDLDTGWSMLAPSMQARMGRASYDSFWGSIRSVSVTDVVVVNPHTVRYRITYTLDSGGTSTESKQLTLVRSGRSYLITSDSSAV
jgi:serine/threonine protein kinase